MNQLLVCCSIIWVYRKSRNSSLFVRICTVDAVLCLSFSPADLLGPEINYSKMLNFSEENY